MFGFVHRIEYDPKRNSLIALITYSNGIMTYTISNEGLQVGDFIVNGENLQLKAGNTTSLNFIPVGLKINSLEIYPNAGAQFIRAAGSFATIISKFNKLGIIKLKSGEIRKVLLNCIATIGTVSNFQYMYRNFRKAGYFRIKG
jgi:large subunit ribosomal protein L2